MLNAAVVSILAAVSISKALVGETTVLMFVGLGIFVLCAVFVGRLSLWNIVGKEILIFDKSELRVVYDYKLFKNKLEPIQGNDWRAFVQNQQQKTMLDTLDAELLTPEKREMQIFFKTDDAVHTTTLKTSLKDTREICGAVEGF